MFIEKTLLEQVGFWEDVKPCLEKLPGTEFYTENMGEDQTSKQYLHPYPWEDGAAIWSSFQDVEAIGMFLIVKNSGACETITAWEQIFEWNKMYFIASNQKRDIDPEDPAVAERKAEYEKRKAEKEAEEKENG